MDKFNCVHFIGIGGVSMSAIAKVLIHNKIKVTGSDFSVSESSKELQNLGAEVYLGHSEENIKNPDLVVYTAAISEDNPELQCARKKGIKTVTRSVMLGELMKNYKKAISVAGTHGKTTTTSMLCYILMKAACDPTVMVGGNLDILNGNFRLGKSDYFLTESCEYHRSFLDFYPKGGIILNVEEDHLDYYKDIDDIKSAFTDFSNLFPEGGTLAVCADNENAMDCVKGAKANVVTYGLKNGQYKAKSIKYDEYGYPSFDVFKDDKKILSLSLNVVGEHNVLNALSAVAFSINFGIDLKYIKEGLEAFTGTKRRFEKKGFCNGALIIDDYAHHPTEISATLKSIEKIKHNNLWCIFQPHTYTRTKALFSEFISALSKADKLILADIYAARELDTGLVSSKDLADKIQGAKYIPDFLSIAGFIKENAKKGDIVLTMGAGNVVNICDMIKD